MRITLIPGDGIGPEVTAAARRCVDAVADVQWEVHEIRAGRIEQETLDSIRRNKICLKGPVTTPIGGGFRSANVALRQALDLFANVRPSRSFAGVASRYKNVNIVVIRENTEDLYAGIEYKHGTADARKLIQFIRKTTGAHLRIDTGFSIKAISHYATKRITNFAISYAKQNRRRKITVVHKANIMKYTDGKFLKTARYVAKRRGVTIEDRIVDNLCMQLVEEPAQFDVLLCPNLYGDIVSDLCAGLAGSIGVAPGANIGDRCAVFEPVHGSAPKYAGKNKVNPAATILAAVMMLKHVGENRAADKLEKAAAAVIREGKHVTYDIARKKPVGTKEMTDAIIDRL